MFASPSPTSPFSHLADCGGHFFVAQVVFDGMSRELDRRFFARVTHRDEGGQRYVAYRAIGFPMLLFSQVDGCPLAALHLRCQETESQRDDDLTRGRSVIAERSRPPAPHRDLPQRPALPATAAAATTVAKPSAVVPPATWTQDSGWSPPRLFSLMARRPNLTLSAPSPSERRPPRPSCPRLRFGRGP